jgi:hypothetical protein
MKWFRHRYPRTFPFAMGGLGGLAGWGIALVARHMSFPWGPAVIVVFCLIVMRMCWAEVQDMQRRIKILQLVQQAAVTQDEALFEAAFLEMKYLDSPGRRLSWRHIKGSSAPPESASRPPADPPWPSR